MPTDFFTGAEFEPWTLAQIYADLCGTRELAKQLNVTLSRLLHWIACRDTNECPYPVRRIGKSDIYSLAQWKMWFGLWELKHITDKRVMDAGPHPAHHEFWGGFQNAE